VRRERQMVGLYNLIFFRECFDHSAGGINSVSSVGGIDFIARKVLLSNTLDHGVVVDGSVKFKLMVLYYQCEGP
jgi:hypothetical protein